MNNVFRVSKRSDHTSDIYLDYFSYSDVCTLRLCLYSIKIDIIYHVLLLGNASKYSLLTANN